MPNIGLVYALSAGADSIRTFDQSASSSSASSMGNDVVTPWPISERSTTTRTLSSAPMRSQALGANAAAAPPRIACRPVAGRWKPMTRPATAATGSTQVRVATPSRWTVQAPHWAMPQPNLVPVSPSVSRSTQRSGVPGVTLTVSRLPLTVKLIGGMRGVLAEDGNNVYERTRGWKGGRGRGSLSFIERPDPSGRLLTTSLTAAISSPAARQLLRDSPGGGP